MQANLRKFGKERKLQVDPAGECGRMKGTGRPKQPGADSNVDDDIICTEKIIADRKTFFLDLKSNARGRVVRITEKVSSNRDRIMVPAEILDDFIAALEDIRKANAEQP